MTEKPPPPHPPRTKSGQHPAVGKYRDKLDSIVDGEAEELDVLNRRLEDFIKESTMPPPIIDEIVLEEEDPEEAS
jgi:hypothetical protein